MSGSVRVFGPAVAVLAICATLPTGSTRVNAAGSGCGIPTGALQATTSTHLVAVDAPARRLEVLLCSKDGGQALQSPAPTITATDTTANGAPQILAAGTVLPAGHTYLVIVTAGADRAGFSFTMGDQGFIWGAPTSLAAAAAPKAPATATTPAPVPAPAPSGTAAAPAPAVPPGTGAPTPRTGVLSDATGVAGGLGAALAGLALCVAARRRRRAR